MDPESKQLWARKIAAVEEPTYEMLITFLEERHFESVNVSQRISTTITTAKQATSEKTQVCLRNNDLNMP
jgi:hypothetical protein